MPRNTYFFIQLIAYGILLDLCGVIAIIGRNAKTVQAHEFPFVVSISRKSSNDSYFEYLHCCTGTLLSNVIVVTAAHCLIKNNMSDVEVVAGSVRLDRGQKYEIQSWITYHKWKHGIVEDQPILDNIAMIKLKGEGVKHRNITPASLVPLEVTVIDDIKVRLAGWGETETGRKSIILRSALLTVMSNEECSKEGTALKGKKFTVPPNYFCSFGEQSFIVSTYGDGGAPLLISRQFYLVGINIGVCPTLREHLHDPQFLNENRLNCHLRIQYYRDFISHNMY